MPLIIYILIALFNISCYSVKNKNIFNLNKCYIRISEIPSQEKTIIDTSQEYLHFKGKISNILSNILNKNVSYSVRPLDFIQSDIEVICKKCINREELVNEIEDFIYSKFNLTLERKTVLVDCLKFILQDSNLLNTNAHVVYNPDDVKSWPSRETRNKINTSNDYPVFLASIDFLLFNIVNIYYFNLQTFEDTITIKNKKYTYVSTKNLIPCKIIDNELFEYYCEYNTDDFPSGPSIIDGYLTDFPVGPRYTCGIPYYITGDIKELKSFMRNKLGFSTESKLTKSFKYRLKYSYM